jgi:hypothetical protein
MSFALRSLCLVLLLLATASTAHAGVHIVAPTGGDHTNIQDAISAAVDGDVILVKSGAYPGFVVVNRDLEIVRDYGQTVTIQGAIRVRNLSVDHDLLIDGMNAVGVLNGLPNERHGFSATSCAGSIRIQNCTLLGASSTQPWWAGSAFASMRIDNCADVVVVDTDLGGSQFQVARDGAELASSNVAFYESVVRGGYHLTTCGYGDMSGADGASVESSYVFAEASQLLGGVGEHPGTGGCCTGGCCCYDGGVGGFGLVATMGSAIEVIETPILGGPGSPPPNCSPTCQVLGMCGCGGASPGLPTSLQPGCTLDVLPPPAHRLSIDAVVRELTNVTLAITGQPGERVTLAQTRETGFILDATTPGVQVFQPAALERYLELGTIGAGGNLTYTLALPDLGAGVTARTRTLQAVFIDPVGNRHLSTPRMLVVLDSAY